jgi:hypothetical protein
VPEWVRALLGDVTTGEVALVGVIFGVIVLFSWAPRIGEAIGGLFDRNDRDGSP